MPRRADDPAVLARQRRIAVIAAAALGLAYLALVVAAKVHPPMKPPVRTAVLATMLGPIVLGLLAAPATYLSERFNRWVAPFYAAGVGMVAVSLLALAFLV
jgi:hypothetical protein